MERIKNQKASAAVRQINGRTDLKKKYFIPLKIGTSVSSFNQDSGPDTHAQDSVVIC